jgi:transcription initiation factor IIE alpha subunit
VKCNRCGHDISKDESYPYLSEILCEDCYLDVMQTAIYEFVKGKATSEEVIENFSIPQRDLERQLAILRHCELIKGHKEGDKVYLVLFDS